jgi:hypothetical protein
MQQASNQRGHVVSKKIPEGYFQNAAGEIKQDRRVVRKERRTRNNATDGDRRNMSRRKSDIAIAKREHNREIEDALETFAEEHKK